MSTSVNDDSFLYNSMLVIALAQFLPGEERSVIRLWLDKLQKITNESQIRIRNEYMWFLLLTLETKRIPSPFCSCPFSGELIPLKDVLAPGVYEEVLAKSTEANYDWIDQIITRDVTRNPKVMSTPPAEFLNNQPKPENGIICYMGAFSDQHS